MADKKGHVVHAGATFEVTAENWRKFCDSNTPEINLKVYELLIMDGNTYTSWSKYEEVINKDNE